MTEKAKPVVTVCRSFEVQFSLPDPHVVQAPPRDAGSQLDRVGISIGSPEFWRIRFNMHDALSVADTLNAIAAKIVELIKENPPK